MQKITPCLWFDTQAEEAAKFYTTVFPDGEVLDTGYYNDAVPERAGQVLAVRFRAAGQEFVALNGGPEFTFSEAISFQIDCADQAEADRYWDTLVEGGEPSQCGWLKDRFGLSWQVIPSGLTELLSDPDAGRASRAMAAMMKQQRLDLAAIRAAADGG